MRYPAAEKLEIIHLVEQSHLPARRTLEKLGIRPSTFYRWYDRYRAGGPDALTDKPSKPDRVWNRIPDEVRERIVTMALEIPELSPRELATRYTDTQAYFVSESSVYRLTIDQALRLPGWLSSRSDRDEDRCRHRASDHDDCFRRRDREDGS